MYYVAFSPLTVANDVRIVEPSNTKMLRVSLGDEFTLRCEGDGDTELDWYHNDLLLTTTRSLSVISSEQLMYFVVRVNSGL